MASTAKTACVRKLHVVNLDAYSQKSHLTEHHHHFTTNMK